MSGPERIFKILNYLLLILFCLSILYVFLHVFALAFNEGRDAARGGISIFPRKPTLENFAEIFRANSKIGRAYLVSVARTVIGTISSVFVTAMAAYAIKGKLPGKNLLVTFLLITMLFSGGIIPRYIVLNQLGLLNRFWVYILPGLYSAWNILVMRAFFQTIPIALEESARIDGAGDFYIFIRIYLPLSGAVIAVISLFNAIGHWNDWFSGAFYVRDENLKPVQTLLQEMLTEYTRLARAAEESYKNLARAERNVTSESIRMAMIVLVSFPVVCIYPFVQKYFVKGLMIGSIKE